MKRGTPEHPKVHALAAALDVPRYAAVGILESLWHFAQEYAPAGDVGRFPDDAISRWVCWDRASSVLVEALNRTGWVDFCHCHRIRIHDWPQHADQTVKRVLDNRNQRLLACYDDPSTVLAPSQPPSRAVAVPLPSLAKPGHTLPSQAQTDLSAAPTLFPVQDSQKPPKADRETWITPYEAAWRSRWGEECEPPRGEMLKALGIARERVGDSEAQARWARFLAASDETKWARPSRFLQGLGEWSENARAAAMAIKTPDQIKRERQQKQEIEQREARIAMQKDQDRINGRVEAT